MIENIGRQIGWRKPEHPVARIGSPD